MNSGVTLPMQGEKAPGPHTYRHTSAEVLLAVGSRRGRELLRGEVAATPPGTRPSSAGRRTGSASGARPIPMASGRRVASALAHSRATREPVIADPWVPFV